MNRLDLCGIAFIFASIIFSVFGLSQIQSNTEDVLQWLPDHSLARQDYDFFTARFGSDDFVTISWSDCTIDDPRLASLTTQIRDNDLLDHIGAITNGAEIAQRLARDMKMSWPEINRRMRGIFFGMENSDQTCIFVEFSELGSENRLDSMKIIWDAIDSVPNLTREEVAIAGYPYVATYIDEQLKNSFRHFLLPSIIMATLVSLSCLRNLLLTLIVFVTATGAALVSVAAVPIFGMKYGGLMSIIPALVFVLATSGSIHLIRYSLSAIGDAQKLLAVGWRPCAISAATTAVGMLSLSRSEFPAIRNFGLFCAAGVGFALAFQLIMVPWLLSRFGVNGLRKLEARSSESKQWESFSGQVRRYKFFVCAVSLAAMVLGGFGLTKLVAEVEVEKLFQPDSEIMTSIADLEKSLGPMDRTELLVIFKDANVGLFADRLNLIRRIQSGLANVPKVGVAYSLANFLPSEPTTTNARSFAKRSAYRSLLRRERENLGNGNLLYIGDDSEIWRISLRFTMTEKNDFGELAAEVVQVADSVVQAAKQSHEASQTPDDDSSVVFAEPILSYTGNTHLFHHAQLSLLTDLFRNFLLAFVIITPILVIVLRSISVGLIAMLPNLFPTLVVFGIFGWIGFPVDLAISMTACVALGIAVDDTTHFLIRFRDHGGSLDNVIEPIQQTIGQCGPAMLHTTLIGTAGLMVYYFSDMLVMSQFSWAISLLLILALLADVIMLPAILFIFGRTEGKSDSGKSDSDSGDKAYQPSS